VGSGFHNVFWGSFYANSPVLGNWEDFVVSDLVNYVESNFRTLQSPDFRGIAGFSMGGLGALNIGMKHPDVFGATYAIAPALFDKTGLVDSHILSQSSVNLYFEIERTLAGLNRTAAHASYLAILGRIWDFTQMSALAYGSAFSPNLEKDAPYIDYPYYNDTVLGVVQNETLWQKYEKGSGSIDEKVQKYRDNLLGLKGIGVEYGLYDLNQWIPKGCRYFAQKLDELNITCQLVATTNGHAIGRIQDRMLPFFALIFKTLRTTDLNMDEAIDLVDITIAAKAFGSRSGNENWNFMADQDRNGIIDIKDLIRIAIDFGKHLDY